MSATKSTSAESNDGATSLAEGLQTDEPGDTRSCPHECHGSLSVTDSDIVICESCRCTPDGTYLPPDDGETDNIEGRGTVFYPSYPHPSRRSEPFQTWGHDEYREHDDGHEYVRLAGGYERVYDEDEDNRPDGVDDEYTFDLSTL